jgi:hypothetical protein
LYADGPGYSMLETTFLVLIVVTKSDIIHAVENFRVRAVIIIHTMRSKDQITIPSHLLVLQEPFAFKLNE